MIGLYVGFLIVAIGTCACALSVGMAIFEDEASHVVGVAGVYIIVIGVMCIYFLLGRWHL